MNWRDLGKRSVPVDVPMQFVALLITLAWITHGHVLEVQSVIPMTRTLPAPSALIGDVMPAVDGQACVICLGAPVPALPLLQLSSPDHEGILQRLSANPGAPGQRCLAHLGQISDWDTLPMQIRFCRWHN